MNPFFSVIIPCYNVSQYVGKCLDSLVSQKNAPDCEFVVVNDGSTDNTLEIINEYAKRDSRIHVIDKPNGGVSAARNDALNVVKGEYVYFVDGDDYLDENALEQAFRLLEDRKAEMLLTNVRYSYPTYDRSFFHGMQPSDYDVNGLFKIINVFPTPPKNFYLSKVIKDFDIRFDANFKVGEVYAFTIAFLRYAQTVRVTEACFYNYVMNDASASHKPNYAADKSVIKTISTLARWSEYFGNNSSYDVTAFKIATAFTYNKYIKARDKSSQASDVVKAVLKNPDFSYFCINTCFRKHKALKERLLALYIMMTGSIGYKLLNSIKK